MCPEPEPADDVRRLAERAATLAAWIITDLDAGDYVRAEANAVAAIDAAVAARELLGQLAGGRERITQLIA